MCRECFFTASLGSQVIFKGVVNIFLDQTAMEFNQNSVHFLDGKTIIKPLATQIGADKEIVFDQANVTMHNSTCRFHIPTRLLSTNFDVEQSTLAFSSNSQWIDTNWSRFLYSFVTLHDNVEVFLNGGQLRRIFFFFWICILF